MRLKQYMVCFLLFNICPVGYATGLEDIPMKAPLIAAKVGIVDLSSFFCEYLENLDSLKAARFQYQEIESSFKKLCLILEEPDSFSAKEEEALVAEYSALINSLNNSHNQCCELMIDAKKLLQNIAVQACEVVAQQKQLDCIVDKQRCFYLHLEENWAYDVTSFVIAEINKILAFHSVKG